MKTGGPAAARLAAAHVRQHRRPGKRVQTPPSRVKRYGLLPCWLPDDEARRKILGYNPLEFCEF